MAQSCDPKNPIALEYWENFKNTYFEEHLRKAASKNSEVTLLVKSKRRKTTFNGNIFVNFSNGTIM